jgi:hypothetical protein
VRDQLVSKDLCNSGKEKCKLHYFKKRISIRKRHRMRILHYLRIREEITDEGYLDKREKIKSKMKLLSACVYVCVCVGG